MRTHTFVWERIMLHGKDPGPARSAPALSLFGGAAGIVGSVFLIVQSLATVLPIWSHGGGSRSFEEADLWLFSAGGWLHAGGSLLCVLSVVAVLRLAGTIGSFAGVVTLLGGFLLLALVFEESRALDAAVAQASSAPGAGEALGALGSPSFAHVFALYLGPLLFGGLAFSARKAVGGVLAGACFVLAVAFAADGIVSGADPYAALPGAVATGAEGLWFLAVGIRVFVRTRVSIVPSMP